MDKNDESGLMSEDEFNEIMRDVMTPRNQSQGSDYQFTRPKERPAGAKVHHVDFSRARLDHFLPPPVRDTLREFKGLDPKGLVRKEIAPGAYTYNPDYRKLEVSESYLIQPRDGHEFDPILIELNHTHGEPEVETHMGVSKPRVLRVEPEPRVLATNYQEVNVNNGNRPIVGLLYPSTTKWTDEDSVLTYLGVFSSIKEDDLPGEVQSTIYHVMLSRLKGLLVVEGEINRRFADQLDAAGYRVSSSVDRTELRIEMIHSKEQLKQTVAADQPIEFETIETRRYINLSLN